MTEQPTLWPGWETLRLIGRGSFGSVYEIQRKLFEDDEEPEKAALKVISIPQNDSDIEEMYHDGYDEESVTCTFHTHLKSIVAEYSLMRKMNGSSNIVNCDDVKFVRHDDGIGWDIFIKMELLTPLVKALPALVTDDLVIKIAKDMCAALELCQKYKIVHRDIKPQNIFVSENGDYKLGDFGIAKTVEKTMGGTKIGTYKYMAPEVYSNQPYNSTADIYSLGLVLYWLLNERRMPFMPLPPAKLTAGMDEVSRNRRFAGEQIPTPKNGSSELKRIVLKACAFDPKDRYQTAREMREDLLRLFGQTVSPVVQPKPIPDPEPIPDSDVDDETIGPDFSYSSGNDASEEEKTVGPDFKDKSIKTERADENLELNVKKRKKPRKLAAIAIVVVIFGLLASWLSVFSQTTSFHQPPPETISNVSNLISQVALITDGGTLYDEFHNQACWQGVENWCVANQVNYTFYQPTEDSNDGRVLAIAQAISAGADTIVLPGYLFGTALPTVMDSYPDVHFIALDVSAVDLTIDYTTFYNPTSNTACITFAEEQAGYLAGYAAVKDGYTKLGFLGGMAVPAVIRYGYGFIQGADAAAQEKGVNIEINYTYGGQFAGSPEVTAKMEGWYQNGTEVVFACGGAIYTSALEAAEKNGGKVIGIDADQSYISNRFITSAMKHLQNTTEMLLQQLNTGNWANYGGRITNLSLSDGDYVGLPTASWSFTNFSISEYETIKNAIAAGYITIDSNTESFPNVSTQTIIIHY